MTNFFTPKLQDAYYASDVDGYGDVDGVGDGDKNCLKKKTLQMFLVSVLLRGHLKRFNAGFISFSF